MTGKDIQAAVHAGLTEFLDPKLVVSEWSVRAGATDAFRDAASYAPRLDIAVGPFNPTVENRASDAEEIRRFDHPLVRLLMRAVSAQDGGLFRDNRNPRCLIAIEVEHNTSSKHILGAITNVSMLGLVGVVIGSAQCLSKVQRIHTYARKLKEVGKAEASLFGNVLCLGEADFFGLLRQLNPDRGSKLPKLSHGTHESFRDLAARKAARRGGPPPPMGDIYRGIKDHLAQLKPGDKVDSEGLARNLYGRFDHIEALLEDLVEDINRQAIAAGLRPSKKP